MGSASVPDQSNGVVIDNNVIWATSNFADSWVDLKGNGYVVQNNSGSGALTDAFQVHAALSGWGVGNYFSGNGQVSGVAGFEVSVQNTASGTVVACAPSGAARGLSNVPCA